MAEAPYIWAVGRRKAAVARVRLYPGSGRITVNGRPATDYFGGRAIYQASLFEPLHLTGTRDRFDVTVRVVGGGVSGQVGAIRHGIARALVRSDEELRPTLKRAQLLTRDARVKERKKVGLKRARKAPQYTKRELSSDGNGGPSNRLCLLRLGLLGSVPASGRASLVATDSLSQCSGMESGALGDVIQRPAGAERRNPRGDG